MADENNEGQAVDLSIDDLFGLEVNSDQLKEAEKELLLKAGTYTTVPPLTVRVQKDKTGRLMVNVFGKVKLLDRDGNTTDQGTIGYRLSPERHNAKDFVTGEDTGKPDRAYKNYVMAAKAFRTAYEREPANLGEVIQYLRDFEHRLRIMQTESLENMVIAISAVPKQQ